LIKELKPYIVGWRGYFGVCQTPRVLTNLEAWIRRRLRLYLWRQWRTRQNRFAELRRRGVATFPAAVASWFTNRAMAHVRTPGGPTSPTQRLFRVARSSPNLCARPRLTRSNRRGTGPVCPVVWEGWRREASPYPDLTSIRDVAQMSQMRNSGHWPCDDRLAPEPAQIDNSAMSARSSIADPGHRWHKKY
jgi:hypothetical protein